MKRYFKGSIKDGKWFSNKDRFRQGVSSLPDGDYLKVLIKISDRTPRESQNYYFVQLGDWEQDSGYTKDELHDIVKHELFTELFGEELSTSVLTKEQWEMVFLNLSIFLTTKFENK